MSKGMTAFWKWMKSREYAMSDTTRVMYLAINGPECLLDIRPQMLEGYMREFLEESGWRFHNWCWAKYDEVALGEFKEHKVDAGPYDYQKVIEEAFK